MKCALIALVVSFAACRDKSAADLLHHFPIGIYDATDPKRFEELHAIGFDTIVAAAPSARKFTDLVSKANAAGLSLVAPRPPDLTKAPNTQFSITAWHLQDEPDLLGMSAQDLQVLSRKMRAWDTSRPQTFVIGQGSAAQKYASIGDIVMLDWYPVPHMKLDSVADQIDTARMYLPAGKPLWFVVQAFDWRDFPQRRAGVPRVGRFPDRFEIRFMSYAAILHGATGLFYYTLARPEGKTLFDYPELLQALAGVVSEIKNLQPMLESGNPAVLPFTVREGLEAKLWRWHGRDYLVLINRTANSATQVPEQVLRPEWRPLFEVHRDIRDLLEKRGDDLYLKPYQVLVLERRLGLF